MGRNDDKPQSDDKPEKAEKKGRRLFGGRRDPEKAIFGDAAVSADALFGDAAFDFGLDDDPFEPMSARREIHEAPLPPPPPSQPGYDDLLLDHESELDPLPPRADIPVIGGEPVRSAPAQPETHPASRTPETSAAASSGTDGVARGAGSVAQVEATDGAESSPAADVDGIASPKPSSAPKRGAAAMLEGTGSRLSPELIQLKARAHEELIGRLSTRLFNATADESELEPVVIEEFAAFLVEEGISLTEHERADLAEELINDVLRHGPIEPLLQDPDVSEVMVNGAENVFVEKAGRLYRTQAKFISEEALRQVISRMASKVGRRIDESSPMVDARLPDGSRVNAIIPPLAVDGSSLTIRKFSADPLTVDDLIRFGSFTMETAGLLDACVRGKLNMLVAGGTGSGKTTLLNVLSSFIPTDERIVTIEDSVELQLHQEHIVRLETRPANLEGRGAIEIRDLVKNSLRMRPDRIVVGECRGGEALDMLQAMNTGHDGSLSTLHANSPRDALSRLETMVLMAGMELPARAIREQIAAAVDVIVHLSRLRDGTRRVMSISEVTGMEGDVITLNDIYQFDFDAGIDEDGRFLGHIKPTGLRPKFSAKLEDYGVKLDPSLFSSGPVDLLGGELVITALALPAPAGVDATLFWGAVLVGIGVAVAFVIESATREIDPEAAEHASLLEKFRSGVGDAADRRLERTGLAQTVRTQLEVVGAKMKPAEFVGLVMLAGLGAAAVGWILWGLPGVVGGLLVPQLAAVVLLKRKIRKQREAFADQLPEMLQLLGGSLRTGMSFTQALSAVGHESPPPAKEELRKVLTENRLGRGFVESLRDVARRMESRDFEWVVSAVEVHEDVGGNLADVLDRVASTIRARNRVKGQVRALSAEGRMSGLVMALLPPAIVLLMWVTNPDYIGELFGDPLGHQLIIAATTLLVLGSYWLRRMARFRF